jgi:hypothetical protein
VQQEREILQLCKTVTVFPGNTHQYFAYTSEEVSSGIKLLICIHDVPGFNLDWGTSSPETHNHP